MTVALGQFELEKALGRGGMAVVWRARHIAQDVPVAIKIMTQKLAREQRHRDAFFEEVRSVARLHHPGIVTVLDVGELSTDAAAHLFLPVHCPYLAMELVEPGALTRARLPRDWDTAYRLTTQLLDALAHSHARRVIHRDIKGDNVLIAGDVDGEWCAKLSDFGLARVLGSEETRPGESQNTSGTPRYMAPEQILGELRRQGPWTDLYALGCVVWWFVSGTPPFTSDDQVEVLKAHLRTRLPPLQPRFDVPADLRVWLARMLAKSPNDRFRRAADAAWALHRIAGFSGGVARGHRTDAPLEAADTVLDATAPSAPPRPETATLADVDLVDAVRFEPRRAERVSTAPPIPRSWKGASSPPLPPRLVGAGLGLYGLRTIPMVDRVSERDAIWHDLRRVATTGSPRVICLCGPAGTGKSRLAESVAERAHEVGAANVLRAFHTPNGGPLDGTAPMLSRFLRCAGLTFGEALERINDEFAVYGGLDVSLQYDAVTLARYITSDGSAETHDASEIEGACCNFLRAISSARPVVLLVDDAQWAPDTLRIVEALLQRGDAPVLILLTVREGDVPEAMVERLAGLQTGAGRRIDVGPLSEEHHRELVAELLGLHEELAEDVATRTAGNPMFAVQLVGDWIERRLLVPGEEGFELRDGADADLPDDVLEVCVARVKRALARLADPGGQLRAIELAACLGRNVDRGEWRAALDAIGLEADPNLENVLADAGLVRISEEGFAFVHASVVESLEEVAKSEGVWAELNAACAEGLSSRSTWTPGLARRRARHYEAAGEPARAAQAWLEHANELANFGEYAEALAVVARRDELLDELDVPGDDRQRVEGDVVRAAVAGETGARTRAERLMSDVERRAREGDWPRLLARVLRLKSVHAVMGGHPSDAERYAREAVDAFQRVGDSIGMARAEHDVGFACKAQGEHEEAREWFERARAGFEEAGNDNLVARALTGLGHLALRRGDVDEADRAFSEAARLAELVGSRQRQAMVAMPLGDLARDRGEPDRARTHWRRAEALWRSSGNPNAEIAALKQVWLDFDEGDYARRGRLERLAAALEARGRDYAVRYARLGIAVAAAHQRDEASFDEAFSAARAAIEAAGDVHSDLLRLAEHAVKQCEDAGWDERAEAARDLAAGQRESL